MKDKYTIQIFGDKDLLIQKIKKSSKEIGELENEIKTKPPEMARMLKQKLEEVLKRELIFEVDKYFTPFQNFIIEHGDDMNFECVNESSQRWKDKQMILNFSCLVDRSRKRGLGDVLRKIDNMGEFSVKSTGTRTPFISAGRIK